METNERETIDGIMNWYKEQVAQKKIMPPASYIEAAIKVNFLIGDLDDEISILRANIADKVVEHVDGGKSVAEAKIRANSGEGYSRLIRIQARREQINEMIRLCKLRARLSDDEYKGY